MENPNFVKVFPGYASASNLNDINVVPNPYVVHSGFSQVSLAHYKNTVLISNHSACEFAPCWRLEECGVKNKPCIFGITPDTVLEIIA